MQNPQGNIPADLTMSDLNNSEVRSSFRALDDIERAKQIKNEGNQI